MSCARYAWWAVIGPRKPRGPRHTRDTKKPAPEAAFAAAVAYVLDDTNPDTAARQYRNAQQVRDEALAAAVQVAAMAGLSEVAAADTIGINRRTVRRHLGKE